MTAAVLCVVTGYLARMLRYPLPWARVTTWVVTAVAWAALGCGLAAPRRLAGLAKVAACGLGRGAVCVRLADWQGDGDRTERWRDRLELPGSYNVVALLEEQPVGMASGVPADEPGVVELISMWVSPTARGRGVGDRLIQAVEQWARQGQAKVLRLSVMRGNEAAERLYQRCGFVGTGVLIDVVPDGVCHEDVMEKMLG